MLIVNNVPLDLSSTKDPRVAKVKEGFKKIRELGFPLIFRDGRGIIMNPSGRPEPAKKYSFPLEAAVGNPETGLDYWRYSKTPIGQNGKYKNKRFTFSERLTIHENEIDFAYFLIYLSDAVKTGVMKLEDKKGDAKKQVLAKQKMISTRFYLFDPSSDYYNEEQLLRTVALSFGISKADDAVLYTLDQIKLALEGVIESAEMHGDRERDEMAFKNALEGSGVVKMKAAVQNAIDEGLITFQEPHWVLLDKEGKKKATLCTIPSTERNRAYELFVEYVQRVPSTRDMLEIELGKEGAFNQPPDLTEEMLNDMPFATKKSWAKKYGYKKFNPTEPEITSFLLSKIQKV